MTRAEASAYTLVVLRARMAHERFDRARFMHATEGAGGPGEPGWMVRAGTMHVPGDCCADGYRFPLADLFREVDSPQGGLFV